MITKQFLISMFRHLLTGLGTYLTTRGVMNSEAFNQLIGPALAGFGIWLSYLNKKKHFLDDDDASADPAKEINTKPL